MKRTRTRSRSRGAQTRRVILSSSGMAAANCSCSERAELLADRGRQPAGPFTAGAVQAVHPGRGERDHDPAAVGRVGRAGDQAAFGQRPDDRAHRLRPDALARGQLRRGGRALAVQPDQRGGLREGQLAVRPELPQPAHQRPERGPQVPGHPRGTSGALVRFAGTRGLARHRGAGVGAARIAATRIGETVPLGGTVVLGGTARLVRVNPVGCHDLQYKLISPGLWYS